jgi:GT2 family glycosyltransferase
MIRSSLFREVGGFDEKFFMYFEDSDLCLRAAKRGYTTHWLSECTLVHHKGKSYDASESRIPLEYRKSQLHYYGKNKSAAERIVLKIYLFIKFSIQLISGTSRDTARKVLKLIITAQD